MWGLRLSATRRALSESLFQASTGRLPARVVPPPGVDRTSIEPSSAASRSAIPCSPVPYDDAEGSLGQALPEDLELDFQLFDPVAGRRCFLGAVRQIRPDASQLLACFLEQGACLPGLFDGLLRGAATVGQQLLDRPGGVPQDPPFSFGSSTPTVLSRR